MYRNTSESTGFTLIELMIAVAIVAIIVAVAIPAYNGYISTARHGVARNNLETLRIYLEDWRLEQGTYQVSGGSFDPKALAESGTVAGWVWEPDGDDGRFDYSVINATTTSYDALAEFATNTNIWVFCEDRMSDCCNNGDSGATKSSCP